MVIRHEVYCMCFCVCSFNRMICLMEYWMFLFDIEFAKFEIL